jgi:hypothetical protein
MMSRLCVSFRQRFSQHPTTHNHFVHSRKEPLISHHQKLTFISDGAFCPTMEYPYMIIRRAALVDCWHWCSFSSLYRWNSRGAMTFFRHSSSPRPIQVGSGLRHNLLNTQTATIVNVAYGLIEISMASFQTHGHFTMCRYCHDFVFVSIIMSRGFGSTIAFYLRTHSYTTEFLGCSFIRCLCDWPCIDSKSLNCCCVMWIADRSVVRWLSRSLWLLHRYCTMHFIGAFRS